MLIGLLAQGMAFLQDTDVELELLLAFLLAALEPAAEDLQEGGAASGKKCHPFRETPSARSESLDALSGKFEGLLERLQTPAAKKGLEAAFHATPAELGRAAVEAARRRR